MRVFKFGGASVKDAPAVRNMVDIIRQHGGSSELLVVVSAMGKTTNAMEALVEAAIAGKAFDGPLAEIKSFHVKIAEELFDDEDKEGEVFATIDKLFHKLKKQLEKPDENPRRWYDQVVSYGELLSTNIIFCYMNNVAGIDTHFVDARRYIQTDKNWKEGIVDWDWTEHTMRADLPEILSKRICITQGFLGGTVSKKTTTLGREGSDFSAAIFGYCLGAESVTIWKDVPGILNADPKRVEETALYDRIPYVEAAEMTYYGATVIHPKTIKPLANKKIPLYVKSFVQPEGEGTCIGDFDVPPQEPAIIFKKEQCILRFQGKDFSNIGQTHLSAIFGTLADLNVKVNMTLSTAVSCAVCVNYDDYKLRQVRARLSQDFDIEAIEGLELLTIKNYTETALLRYASLYSDGAYIRQQTRNNFQAVVEAKA